ncbi:amidohydrolase family protein [Neobacillus muris]|uniref:amidohydrolase family protein n=1 Tax=Neobacillus muris TaxID=2941334 RepID=UPI00203C3AC4|nr:amidohydrolase family protein [Neobacillus muris]
MIDIHTHPVQVADLYDGDPNLTRAVRDVFGFYVKPQPLDTFLYQLDEAGIDQAVLLPIDCTTTHGCKIVSNEQIVELVEKSDRFIGFASVDPLQPNAPKDLEKAIKSYGLRGLKLDPSLQGFSLHHDEYVYPIFQVCEELDIPVLLHCGMSWSPIGRAELAQPIHLERIIHRFPNVRMIIAQFGWPWVAESLMLALKHQNVYLDTSILFSGTPPESFRHVVEKVIGLETFDRSLHQQVVFGSSYPRVDPKRVVGAIKEMGFRESLEKKIFHDNAARLLKLEGQSL